MVGRVGSRGTYPGTRMVNASLPTSARKMLVELHGEEGLLKFQPSYRAGNGKLEPSLVHTEDFRLVVSTSGGDSVGSTMSMPPARPGLGTGCAG
jgi:hypothetical protein